MRKSTKPAPARLPMSKGKANGSKIGSQKKPTTNRC